MVYVVVQMDTHWFQGESQATAFVGSLRNSHNFKYKHVYNNRCDTVVLQAVLSRGKYSSDFV